MLERKIRRIGSSLVITIPMQMAECFGYKEGMTLNVVVGRENIVYTKVR
jgi:antitoxin component of MazEF toxin-antitoxin module